MNTKYQKLKTVLWSMWSDVQIEDTCGELMQILSNDTVCIVK